jgi:hypothetical protein
MYSWWGIIALVEAGQCHLNGLGDGSRRSQQKIEVAAGEIIAVYVAEDRERGSG